DFQRAHRIDARWHELLVFPQSVVGHVWIRSADDGLVVELAEGPVGRGEVDARASDVLGVFVGSDEVRLIGKAGWALLPIATAVLFLTGRTLKVLEQQVQEIFSNRFVTVADICLNNDGAIGRR